MNLEAQLTALKTQKIGLPRAQRAELSCRLAKQLEKVGKYELAYEALSEFWPDRNESPNLDELDEPHKAQLLLRIGAIAGWLGSTDQTAGGQETAKNIITSSIEIFERLKEAERVSEARGDLALCYYREGSFDEARVQLRAALQVLPDGNDDLKGVLLIRAGIIEERTRRLNEALQFYNRAAPLVERSEDHALKGSYHFEYGLVLRRLSAPENREDYLDRALIEYAASSFHYEQAGNELALARVELNLGHLFFKVGRYSHAHDHLNVARHLFLKLKDAATAAQVDDTRARTLLSQGHAAEAERIARNAVRVLERGGQQALLAEALTTQGVALARLGNYARAKALLERAVEVAETTGDLEGAGRAKLSTIEELGKLLSIKELISIYRSAVDLVRGSQDPATGKRLITCAEHLFDVVERLEAEPEPPPQETWDGFSLKQYIRDGERSVIERALRDAGGSVTKAARLLGFKHHQSLISLINGRHKELLDTRSKVRQRRRHIVRPKKHTKRTARHKRTLNSVPLSILHVEDHPMVAKVVGDMLEAANYRVELCTDGKAALAKLTGDDHYDVLVIDNELPGLNGLELVRTKKKMSHRRRMPIIMLSGDDIEKQAWSAGADEFLRKPEGVERIAATVERVLAANKDT